MTPDEFLSSPVAKYSDWFGNGNSHDDFKMMVQSHGTPDHIFKSGFMLLLQYPDKFVVYGYDGNEYIHEFVFETGVPR